MKAHTISIITGRRRRARRRAIALALGVCALAIPATAGAQPIDGGYSTPNATIGGSNGSSQPINGAAAGNAHRTPTELGQSTAGRQSSLTASVQPPHGVDYSSVSITPPASAPTESV